MNVRYKGTKAMCDTDFQKAYEIALSRSELESNHFVSRFNGCIVVQGALLAFAVRPILTVTAGATLCERIVGLAVAISGVLLSLLSLRILSGAYFWVSYWEYRVNKFEDKVFPPDITIFRNLPYPGNKKVLEELRKHSPHLRYHGSPRKAMLAIFYLFWAVWSTLFLIVTVPWLLSML